VYEHLKLLSNVLQVSKPTHNNIFLLPPLPPFLLMIIIAYHLRTWRSRRRRGMKREKDR